MMIKATQHKADRLIERYGIEKALEVVEAEIDALYFQGGVQGCDNRGYWYRVKELIKKEKNVEPAIITAEIIAFNACEVSTKVLTQQIKEYARLIVKLDREHCIAEADKSRGPGNIRNLPIKLD